MIIKKFRLVIHDYCGNVVGGSNVQRSTTKEFERQEPGVLSISRRVTPENKGIFMGSLSNSFHLCPSFEAAELALLQLHSLYELVYYR